LLQFTDGTIPRTGELAACCQVLGAFPKRDAGVIHMNKMPERSKNTSILVIEDDDINMDIMIFALNSLGWSAIPALNGPVGLAIAKAERPCLILCDIRMPHLDGYGVLAGLRADSSVATIPILAVTSLVHPQDGDHLIAAGFDGYLGKPIQLDALKSALLKHLCTSLQPMRIDNSTSPPSGTDR
jgi:CheY-like chemotaxis protein